ncbi:hypothetical protein KKA95_02035, partial [Patescibacteria group bacterium]|nr:hypothetical protein [Patescibacteria group bacterium]
MPKTPAHYRPDKLRIPSETLKDALSRPSSEVKYVSRKVQVQGNKEVQEERLSSENHAFYIGKMFPKRNGDNPLYTREFITAALDNMFQNLEEGEKAQIIIGRSLSELFNGPQDIKGALTLEEQRDLIHKIAWKRFKKDSDHLEVLEFSEHTAHALLYQILRENIDTETGTVDFPKAMNGLSEELDDVWEIAKRINDHSVFRVMANTSKNLAFRVYNPDSLMFTKILHQAFEKDDRFKGAVEHTVPEHIKEADIPSASHYGIAEIAMRLADIKNGRYIHGGAERQQKYDLIIRKIIQGKEGGYKNINELEPLFEAMQGCRFETMHLKTAENYYELQRRAVVARSRIGIILALLLASLGAAYLLGRYDEHRKQEEADALVESDLEGELKNITMHRGGGFGSELSKEWNVSEFNEIVNEALVDIGHRYNLSDEMLEDIKPFLQKHFLDNKRRISTIYGGNTFVRVDIEDSFVQENDLYFKSKGVVPGRPYQELYEYMDDFQALLDSDESLEVDDKEERGITDEGRFKPKRKDFEYIGTFYSGEERDNAYEFYWVTIDGRKNLVAKTGTGTYGSLGPGPVGMTEQVGYSTYSSRRAKEGIYQFLYSIKRYDGVQLFPHYWLANTTEALSDYNGEEFGKVLCRRSFEKPIHVEVFEREVGVYRDYFGKFDYEFIVKQENDDDSFAKSDCLLARRPGETDFTDEAGVEMAIKYVDTVDAWYEYHRRDYVEDFLPLNFAEIEGEI